MWMRYSCLFTEYVGRVRKDGGKATAASTVVPSMFRNSVRISSQTYTCVGPCTVAPDGEYYPNLLSMSDAFCDGEVGGSADPYQRVCREQFSKESQALLISYPGWLPMRRGDWAKLQNTLGPVYDLRLYLVTLLYTMNSTPCKQSYWKES